MTKKKAPHELLSLSKLPDDCALSEAVRFFGSKTALATALGLGKKNVRTGQQEGGRQVVSQWFRTGSIPKMYVEPIHALTGIPVTELLKNFPPYRPNTKGKDERSRPARTAEDVYNDLRQMPSAERQRFFEILSANAFRSD